MLGVAGATAATIGPTSPRPSRSNSLTFWEGDKLGRRLPDALREAVFERDCGKCRLCGKPGEEIDHVSGGANDINNLQLLCDSCHNQKTVASFVKITKESHPEAWAKAWSLRRRAAAHEPLQLCDSDEWSQLRKALLKKRNMFSDDGETGLLFGSV